MEKDKHPKKCDIVISLSDEIHFVYAWKKRPVHFKIHLSEFLPKDIWRKYAPQPGANLEEEYKGKQDCGDCKVYKDKIISLEKERDDLKRNQSAIEIDRRAIEQREEKLKQKYEQVRKELDDAKAEISKLRKSKIDITKYMEWSADEFVDYICTVEDGRFLKYEDVLRENFKNEEVSGEAIPHIEKNEWREFGVRNYMDRTQLHKCIKDLVNGKIDEGGYTNF